LRRRTYRGRLLVSGAPGELRLVNEVELEDYVASVVAAELDRAPRAAREALAVVARSFAWSAQRAGHLCDGSHCQWYRGSEKMDAAARGSAGEVLLLSDGSVAPAFHSQDCGGTTARARDVWPGASEAAQEASSRAPDAHLPAPRGRGHGVGFCQRGAIFQATRGASAHQILARYFPHLHLGRPDLLFDTISR
jgi:peptidoglycan hydrolase-like amidase